MAPAATAKDAAPGKTAETDRSNASLDQQSSDFDRERMQALVERHVHRPLVPKTVKLMRLIEWKDGIRNVMSAEGMRAAGTGLACLDKGMAKEGGFRVIRRFVRNAKAVFEDPVLLEHSPLLFDFLKTLMEL